MKSKNKIITSLPTFTFDRKQAQDKSITGNNTNLGNKHTPQFNVVVAQKSSQRSRSCHISFECAENYIKFTVCLMHENTTKKSI